MIEASDLRQIIVHAIDGEKPAVDLLITIADWLQLQLQIPVGAASDIQKRYDEYYNWQLAEADDGGIIVDLAGVL